MRTRLTRWLAAACITAAVPAALAACGAEDPTATPRPTATPVPTAMAESPTPTPAEAMMEATPTPMPVARATATPTPRPAPTAPPAPAGFDAAEYFGGKTIRIVANSSPGGGTDTQGRVMAAFMQRYIPGNPRVVFTNQPNKPLEYLFAATLAP